jgi:hypothetical protein
MKTHDDKFDDAKRMPPVLHSRATPRALSWNSGLLGFNAKELGSQPLVTKYFFVSVIPP